MKPVEPDAVSHDDAAAEFTDRLRAEKDAALPPALADLEPVVRGLHRVIPPDPLDDVVRARLMERVMAEWDQQRAAPRRFRAVYGVPKLLVAAAAWVLLVCVLLLAEGEANVLSGTALGGLSALFVAAVPAGLVVLAWWLRRPHS